MKRGSFISAPWLKLCLFSLLLAAQSLALAHELDHIQAGETSLCAVCSAGQVFEHAVSDTPPELHCSTGYASWSLPETSGVFTASTHAPLARGPPVTL